jgi:hypothetical protein
MEKEFLILKYLYTKDNLINPYEADIRDKFLKMVIIIRETLKTIYQMELAFIHGN